MKVYINTSGEDGGVDMVLPLESFVENQTSQTKEPNKTQEGSQN